MKSRARMTSVWYRGIGQCSLAALLILAGSANAGPRKSVVRFDCIPVPDKPLPAAIERLVVLEPQVSATTGREFGAINYADIFRGQVERALMNAYPDKEIKVRGEDLATVMEELRLQQLNGADEGAGQIQAVNAIVETRLDVNVRYDQATKRVWKPPIPFVSPGVTRWIRIYRRNITAGCSIRILVPGSTGAWHVYSDSLTLEDETKPGVLQMQDTKITDLPPLDTVFKNLMERHLKAFLREIVATGETCTAEFETPRRTLAQALRMFQKHKYANAKNLAEQAVAEADNDVRAAQAQFLIGIIAEHLPGVSNSKALKYYKKAQERHPGKQYALAIARIEAQLGVSDKPMQGDPGEGAGSGVDPEGWGD